MTSAQAVAEIRNLSTGWQIQRLSGWIERRVAELLVPLGLSHREFALLMTVLENPGLRQNEIGARFSMPDYAVSRGLSDLQARGLVVRRAQAGSRRAHAIHPTPQAESMLPDLRAVSRGVNADLLAALSPDEAAALRDLLGRVLAATRGD